MRKILTIVLCLVLFVGSGCKVTQKVGNAFKTAGTATAKAVVITGKSIGKATTKTWKKITGRKKEKTKETKESKKKPFLKNTLI